MVYLDHLVSGLLMGATIYATFFTDYVHEWHEYAEDHPEWHIEELFHLLPPIVLILLIFLYRRHRQMRRVLAELRAAQIELKEKEEIENQREKMAALGHLASGLAHEVNNSLQPIMGLSDVLIASSATENQMVRDGIVMIHESALHIRDVVRKVNTFSRSEKEAQLQVVPFFKTFDEVFGFTSMLVPATVLFKNNAIDGDIHKLDNAHILISKSDLIQVLTNLITNAVYAMKGKGEVNVDISKVKFEGKHLVDQGITAGPHVQIAVKDTGSGMDEQTIHRAFDPFFTTKPEGEGTGLGLSTVYGIVKSWGGDIKIQSCVGHGTSVIFTIPIYGESHVA